MYRKEVISIPKVKISIFFLQYWKEFPLLDALMSITYVENSSQDYDICYSLSNYYIHSY